MRTSKRIGLWVGILFLVAFLLGSSVHSAATPTSQTSGELIDNSGNTLTGLNIVQPPANGFAQFNATCNSLINPWQQLIVCNGTSPCLPSSPSILCSSPFVSNGSPSCSTVIPNRIGLVPFSASCCNVQGSCAPISITLPLVVGVTANLIGTSDSFSAEMKSQHVYRFSNSGILAALSNQGYYSIHSSANNGVTWPTTLNFIGAISPANLPGGESSFKISQLDFTTFSNGRPAVIFALEGATSNNSSIFYSQCTASSNCGSIGNWTTPIPILNPLLTTSQSSPQLYTHLFSNPDLELASANALHVLFYDASPGSNRIPGIFHYYCVANCTNMIGWNSPSNGSFGSDVTHGLSVIASDPELAVSGATVHALWKDNSRFFYSSYDAVSDSWLLNNATGTNYSLGITLPTAVNYPYYFSGDASKLSLIFKYTLPNGNFQLDGHFCSQGSCETDTKWVRQAELSKFEGRNLGQFGPSFSSSGIPYFVFGDVDGSDLQHHLYATHSDWSASGLMDLPTFGSSSTLQFQSIDPQLAFGRTDFLTNEGGNGYLYSVSGLTGASNNAPTISLSAPPASSWTTPLQSTSGSVPVFTQNFSFTARDLDAPPSSAEILYVSIGLGSTSGVIQYPIVSNLNLQQLQNVPTGFAGCGGGANAGFAVQQTCTVVATIISPTTQLAIPDGVYYLSARINDLHGGSATSNGGLITVNVSAGQFTLTSPTHNQQYVLASASTNLVQFIVSNPLFAQYLRVRLTPAGQSVNVSPITYSIKEYGVLNASACTHNVVSNSFVCAFPLNNSVLPENSYDLQFELLADGIVDGNANAQNVLVDTQGPHILNGFPSGALAAFPASGSFTLEDYSGVENIYSVTLNGNPVPYTCPTGGATSIDCSVTFSGVNPNSTTNFTVQVISSDGVANDSTASYAFTIPSGPGGPGPGPGPGPPDGGPDGPTDNGRVKPPKLVNVNTDTGDIEVVGTPIVISRNVVESIRRFSNDIRAFANDLVEVTGPSATAIFIGICTLAGIASDTVYRRMFNQVKSADVRRREILIRATLAGVFSLLPLGIGLGISLALGLIFVVLEFVGFAVGWFIIQNFQRAHAFGFTPLAPIAVGSYSSLDAITNPNVAAGNAATKSTSTSPDYAGPRGIQNK